VILGNIAIHNASCCPHSGLYLAIHPLPTLAYLRTGFAPRVLKRTTQTALVWTMYEELVPGLSKVLSFATATVTAMALQQQQQQQPPTKSLDTLEPGKGQRDADRRDGSRVSESSSASDQNKKG